MVKWTFRDHNECEIYTIPHHIYIWCKVHTILWGIHTINSHWEGYKRYAIIIIHTIIQNVCGTYIHSVPELGGSLVAKSILLGEQNIWLVQQNLTANRCSCRSQTYLSKMKLFCCYSKKFFQCSKTDLAKFHWLPILNSFLCVRKLSQ